MTMAMSAAKNQTATPQKRAVTLSVVVGCMNARFSVADCLKALQSQLPDDAEIIVVDNSTDGTTQIIETQFPKVRLLRQPDCAYIPQLWGRGVAQSGGEIIALTTAHCVPDSQWIAQIHAAHHRLTEPIVGIGGAIENDPNASLTDWAVYFCRYAAFSPPFAEQSRHDIAGDNASYRRAAIDASASVWQNGFWEPDVHACMAEEGGALAVTPHVVVTHRHSYGFFAFLSQRIQHGFQYGASRAARELRGIRRLIYIAAGLLIPLMLLRRTLRQIGGKKRYTGRLLTCLPILACFFIAWSLGEWAGYLFPERQKRSH